MKPLSKILSPEFIGLSSIDQILTEVTARVIERTSSFETETIHALIDSIPDRASIFGYSARWGIENGDGYIVSGWEITKDGPT